MKHLFAALAPLYFVYLLKHYCRCDQRQKSVVTHLCIIQKPLQTHYVCMLSVSSLHCHVCPLLQHRVQWCSWGYAGGLRGAAQWKTPGLIMQHALQRQSSWCHSWQVCWRRGPAALQRFLTLGAVTAAVFATSFGPFIAAGQVHQVALTQGNYMRSSASNTGSLQEPFLGVPCTSRAECSLCTSRRCYLTLREILVLQNPMP